LPEKTKRRKVKVPDALRLLVQEEAAKLIDMDKVTREALKRVEQSGIVFLDEIDKISSRSETHRGSADVSREGVQRDLLPLIEGTTIATKYGPVKTDHILFIASGAFHTAKPADLLPELQGRLPIRVELQPLEERHDVKPKTAAAALGRGLFHPAEANLNGHVVHVPPCGELLHRDRLPVKAKLPVAALPHALGQDLLGLVEVRADGLPTASACRVVVSEVHAGRPARRADDDEAGGFDARRRGEPRRPPAEALRPGLQGLRRLLAVNW